MNLLWSPSIGKNLMLVTVNDQEYSRPLVALFVQIRQMPLFHLELHFWNYNLIFIVNQNQTWSTKHLDKCKHYKTECECILFLSNAGLEHPVARERCTRSFLLPTWVLRHSKLVVESAAGDGLAGVWHWVVSCIRHIKQTLVVCEWTQRWSIASSSYKNGL